MTRPLSFRILLVCLLALCTCDRASGQTTGRIAGTVKDQHAAAIPRAEVISTSEATGESRWVSTDETGDYVISLLVPGAYRLSFVATGFKRVVLDEIHVEIAQTTTLNAILPVGSVSDSVTVSTAAPLIQTDGPQLGRVVDTRVVSALPLATRNITQILSLSAGTATYLPDSTGVGRNTQTISVNGARMTQNNYEINGIDANTMGTASAVNVAIPAPESVEEFKVQTSLYDATFGRAGGANIQVVTKSGTNEFHGEAYENFSNDALNANNPFLIAAGASRPELKRNIFGGTLGGPMRKEHAFFFVSYQGTRERNGASLLNSLSSAVLIAPGLTDDRSQATLLATFHPVLPNGQPATAIDPAALALLNAKLPGGAFAIPAPRAVGLYSGSAVSDFQEDQFSANGDLRITANNMFSAKSFVANGPSTLVLPSLRGTGSNVPGFGAAQQNNVRVIALRDAQIISKNILNEVRLGYNRQFNGFVPEEPLNDSDLGIKRANATELPGLPLIRVAPTAGGVIIGTPADISPATPSVVTLSDLLLLQSGHHSLRTGVEVRYNQVIFSPQRFTRGQIDFGSFNNFLVGVPSLSIFGSGISYRNQRAWDYNFFTQDDWKISPKWTLNLGLRYELDLPPYEASGRAADFDPSLYQPPTLDSSGKPIGPPLGGFVQAENVAPQFDLPGLPKVNKYLVHTIDDNDFAPRIGFAYSPFDAQRIAVRGGYGIFYSRATFVYLSATAILPPMYVVGRRSTNVSLVDPFFAVPPVSQFPKFVPGVNLAGTIFDRDLVTPYLQQFNLSVQYEPRSNFLFEIAYVGTRGLHLFRQVAINQAGLASVQKPIINNATGLPITTNTPANATLRAPLQGVVINGFLQNQTSAQSNYNSLQLSATRSTLLGLMLLASYTFAKSIDNASGTGGGAGINGIVNPGAINESSGILGNQLIGRANRGVSDFDRKHRFVLSTLWDLPGLGFTQGSLAHKLLSDWQIGGIITAMSGLPIDIADTGAGQFYGLDSGSSPLARPNLMPGATCQAALKGVPVGYFFNPLVFARPIVPAEQLIPSSGGTAVAGVQGTDIGDVGRNCLRGPRQVNADFSIVRRVKLAESKNIEFGAEFFNLFNHVNFANPISDLNAVTSSGGSLDQNTGRILKGGTFGRIISTSNNPRIVQLSLKFNF
jgi:hypothetical protein